jgi:hypothetical protein
MLLKCLAFVSLLCSLVIASPALAAPLPGASTLPLLAQASPLDITAADITNFANAYEAIQTIKQDAENDMVAAVEAEGLTVEQFNTIAQTQLEAEDDVATDVSDEETAQFRTAVEEIIAIRQTAELEMQTAIEAEGLSVEDFNQILAQAEEDTDLQQQIRDELTD